jgi:hypothetical protein
VLFGSLIVLVLTVRPVGAAFAWRPVSWLGYRSYSLFLIHQPTLWYASEFLQKFLGVPEGPLLLALLWTVGFGAVLGVGLVLFITVERPCITWAKRVPSSRAPATPEPMAPTSTLPAAAAPVSAPATPTSATPPPETPSPATPSPATPAPATSEPVAPASALPAGAAPAPATPATPATPAPETPVPAAPEASGADAGSDPPVSVHERRPPDA